MAADKRATVLVVEDNPIVSTDLGFLLENAGFGVCAYARDGEEAVELARKHEPDLILMDLSLPVLDGIEAIRQICHERNVPIVAITGHTRSDLVDRAIDAGAIAHVPKPFNPTRLVDVLSSFLRG